MDTQSLKRGGEPCSRPLPEGGVSRTHEYGHPLEAKPRAGFYRKCSARKIDQKHSP
jgi:hypothetical protein